MPISLMPSGSPYSYYSHDDLDFTAITTPTALADHWEVELLSKEYPTGVRPDTPFFTIYEGVVNVDFTATGNFEFSLILTHTIARAGDADLSFDASRTVTERINRQALYALPLSLFNSVSEVHIGPHTYGTGSMLDLRAADFDVPIQIDLKLRVELASGGNFGLRTASIARAASTSYQLR